MNYILLLIAYISGYFDGYAGNESVIAFLLWLLNNILSGFYNIISILPDYYLIFKNFTLGVLLYLIHYKDIIQKALSNFVSTNLVPIKNTLYNFVSTNLVPIKITLYNFIKNDKLLLDIVIISSFIIYFITTLYIINLLIRQNVIIHNLNNRINSLSYEVFYVRSMIYNFASMLHDINIINGYNMDIVKRVVRIANDHLIAQSVVLSDLHNTFYENARPNLARGSTIFRDLMIIANNIHHEIEQGASNSIASARESMRVFAHLDVQTANYSAEGIRFRDITLGAVLGISICATIQLVAAYISVAYPGAF